MQEKVHIHKINKRKLMISTRELKEKRGRREKKRKKLEKVKQKQYSRIQRRPVKKIHISIENTFAEAYFCCRLHSMHNIYVYNQLE